MSHWLMGIESIDGSYDKVRIGTSKVACVRPGSHSYNQEGSYKRACKFRASFYEVKSYRLTTLRDSGVDYGEVQVAKHNNSIRSNSKQQKQQQEHPSNPVPTLSSDNNSPFHVRGMLTGKKQRPEIPEKFRTCYFINEKFSGY